ncbi:polysaccharide deacetylase [Paeniglutamicibacter cryotolerans]|uniref:Peptidoglycan/xylan/chitin deacetylase (PgdA/CDA1 family) n=1 Tax=Paeniglutamicibacter cryotolerans TaxID=670079 RepID=A0A839QI35_9MICC|nr:polysaccharide deacetylase [Paeniglutamicibacter cryotolerans]MBB2995530.1 peptidoglycan/xylan/chitin deacetylase (PgdA/CDA1 family) [Paeniglutamicibacter cryotolerans]
MSESMKYRAIALMGAGSLLLAGCTPLASPPPGQNAPVSSHIAGTTGATQTPEAPKPDETATTIKRARTLAASYDYDAALKLLAGIDAPETADATTEIKAAKSKAKVWATPNQIPHLFFHSLVVDTKRAFDGDDREQGYLDYMATIDEFNKIIAELHKRGYVLVNPEDFAGLDKNGKMKYRDIRLPAGKKPLVLSQDDVSYYEYMDGDGFPTKLLLDEHGKVKNSYADAAGKTTIGDYDMVPLLDSYVAKHPDFSYRGAKGIIALTGYNGVLGYRTSASEYPENKNLAQDTATATAVADAMKKEGWVFASHAWGHIDMGRSPMPKFKHDMKLWDAEVRPIIGDTDQFIYPFGADISGVPMYSGERYNLLKKDGFDFFYGVDGTTTAWMQQGDAYQRQARINIDGLQFAKELKGDRPVLKTFFDVKKVIDKDR